MIRNKTFLRALICLMIMSLAATCNQSGLDAQTIAAASGLEVWLDQPPDGASLPLAAFTLRAHARNNNGGGVTRISFLINNNPVGVVNTSTTEALVAAEFSWTPSVPGQYTIQAQAFNATDSQLSAVATVCVSRPDGTGCAAAPNKATLDALALTQATRPPQAQATTQPAPVTVPPSSGKVDSKSGASPSVVYYGKCVNKEPQSITFEIEIFNAKDVLEAIVDYKVGSTSQVVAMKSAGGLRYTLVLDTATFAASLGDRDAALEYSFKAIDSNKNFIVETPIQKIEVIFCKGTTTGATTAAPRPVTATFTRTPQAAQPVVTTPAPAQVQINFTADSTNLSSGQCTTLRWNVQNVNGVFLNGEGVAGVSTREVCPKLTTTYTLHIESAAGASDRAITITVAAPPTVPPAASDTTGPAIKVSGASPSPTLYGGCGGTVTLSASVTDPSGIGSVQIWYRYESGKSSGGWLQATVSASGSTYNATINHNAGNQAYTALNGGNGSVRWYVLSTDKVGNNSDSGDQLVEIQYCPG